MNDALITKYTAKYNSNTIIIMIMYNYIQISNGIISKFSQVLTVLSKLRNSWPLYKILDIVSTVPNFYQNNR